MSLDPALKGRPLVLWDLDSTLCNTQHRHWFAAEVREGKSTWDDYSMLCADDVPVPGALALMRQMDRHAHAALSARSECARGLTETWVRAYSVPLDGLILLPDLALGGSNTGLWKAGEIRKLLDQGFSPVLMLEDNRDNAACIMRETGIPVLGVNPLYANDHTALGAV